MTSFAEKLRKVHPDRVKYGMKVRIGSHMPDAPQRQHLSKNELIQQVMGLIHLAMHSEKREASLSAALAAVRIIDEYKLQFVGDKPKIEVTLPSSKPVMTPFDAGVVARQAPAPIKRIRIVSKFDTHCSECDDDIEEGDTVWWARGEGSLCDSCYSED